MSKILAASCQSGVVSIDGVVLPDAEVLSEGVAASTGVAVLDEDTAFYLAKISPDLKSLIEQVVDVLTQVKTALDKTASALTTVDAKPVGGTGSAPAPGAAADITAISAASTQIDTLKTNLNTFKGALR